MATLHPDAFDNLKQMLEALEPEIKHMTGSSPGFVQDMMERVERYGPGVFVSPKQLDWVRTLYEKHVGPLDGLGPDAQQGAREDLIGNDDPDDDIPF